MIILILLLLVLLAGFILNNWFTFKFWLVYADNTFHFQAAEQIKKNKYKLYSQIETYAIKNPPDYPPLFQYILALLPKDKLVSWGKYIGSVFDVCNKLLLFYVTNLITQNAYISLLAVCFYSVIPIAAQEQIEASPRTLSNLLFNGTIMSFYFFITTNNILYLLLIVILASFILLMHRFSIQTLLFLSLGFLALGQPLLFFLFGAGIILSILITKGYSLKLIKGHIAQLKFWRKMNKLKFRRSTANINKLLVYIYELFLTNPLDLLTIFFIAILSFNNFNFLLQWIIFIRIISFLILSVPQLKFVGEGYRYLAYSAFPAAMLSAILVATYSELTIIYVIASVLGILALLTWQITIMRQKTAAISIETVNSIRNLKDQDITKLLVLPYTFGKVVAYISKKNTFFTVSPFYFNYIKDLYWELEPVEKICKKNSISHLFVLNDKAAKYNLSFARQIYNDGIFTLYKV